MFTIDAHQSYERKKRKIIVHSHRHGYNGRQFPHFTVSKHWSVNQIRTCFIFSNNWHQKRLNAGIKQSKRKKNTVCYASLFVICWALIFSLNENRTIPFDLWISFRYYCLCPRQSSQWTFDVDKQITELWWRHFLDQNWKKVNQAQVIDLNGFAIVCNGLLNQAIVWQIFDLMHFYWYQ